MSSSSKVYVGDLGRNGDRDKIWKAFSQYGTLNDVWVARNPPGFAFVEFEDTRDAEDAVAEMDGKSLCGQAVKVEISHRQSRGSGGGGGRRGGGGGSDRGYRGRRSDDGGYRRGDRFERSRYSPPPRRRSRSPPRGGRSRSPAPHYSRRSRSHSPVPRQ